MQYCFVKNTSKTEIQLFDTVQWSTKFDTKIIVINLVIAICSNLTKVKPLFMLWHRGSDNSPLLIVFSANYIDQSIITFMRLKVG